MLLMGGETQIESMGRKQENPKLKWNILQSNEFETCNIKSGINDAVVPSLNGVPWINKLIRINWMKENSHANTTATVSKQYQMQISKRMQSTWECFATLTNWLITVQVWLEQWCDKKPSYITRQFCKLYCISVHERNVNSFNLIALIANLKRGICSVAAS